MNQNYGTIRKSWCKTKLIEKSKNKTGVDFGERKADREVEREAGREVEREVKREVERDRLRLRERWERGCEKQDTGSWKGIIWGW